MEVLGLDGKIYKWNPLNNKRVFSSNSTYHERARQVIKELFPFDIILEEVDLPGSKTSINGILRADFYVPKHHIMIEIHGEQHYKMCNFFHGNEKGYRKAQMRDNNKQKWCSLNNIRLVELPYNEDNDSWKRRIQ